MPSNTYDVVVLGNELPGLIAATLCASRGYRVAHLPGDTVPSVYTAGGFSLPVEPFSMIGLEAPAIAKTVEELHFTHLLRRKLRPTRTAFQLVTPTARLDVVADDVILLRELDRELGKKSGGLDLARQATEIARGLDAIFAGDATVPAASYRARRDQGRIVTALNAESSALFAADDAELLRTLWRAPAAVSCSLWPEQQPAIALLRLFDLWRQGAPRFEGHAGGLRDLFVEKFHSQGGETLEARPVELTYSWGKVSGVMTRGGDELGASQVIAAMPIDELALLAGEKGVKKVDTSLEGLEPAGYRYTLNIVVDESGVPEGMGETVLAVARPGEPLLGGNLLAIFVGEPDDRARVVVSVTAICPAPPKSSHIEAEFANLRVAVRESLESVMPFVAEHTLLIHSPHEALPAQGREATKNGAAPALFRPRPVWRTASDGAADMLEALPYTIGLKNLVMASEQVMPALGLEGLFAIGHGAAKLATAGIGKRRSAKGEVIARG